MIGALRRFAFRPSDSLSSFFFYALALLLQLRARPVSSAAAASAAASGAPLVGRKKRARRLGTGDGGRRIPADERKYTAAAVLPVHDT